MAWTEAQQAAIDRALGRVTGRANEDEDTPTLSEGQRAAIENATRRIEERYGPRNEDTRGDFRRGVSAGIDSFQGTAYGLAGLAGDALERTTGIGGGIRDWGFEGYQRNMAEVDRGFRDDTYTWDGATSSLGNFADAAQYWAGYALPDAAAALASGGIGAAIAKRTISEGTEAVVQNQVRNLVGDAAARQVTRSTIGSTAAVGAQAVGQSMGGIYGQAGEEALARGESLSDVDLGRVAGYGLAAGGLEFVGDVVTLGAARLGPARNLMDFATSGGRVRQGITRGLGAAGVESVTEGVQTGLEDMGAGASFSEARFMDPTSMFAGAIGGGTIGGAGGFIRPSRSGTDLNDQGAANDAEEIQLQAQALAEQQAAEQEALAQERAIKEARLQYAPSFMSEADFVKRRNQQRVAAVADPTSEIGQAFREWQLENDIYPANDKEAKKAQADFLKAYVPANDSQAARGEYIAALDSHVARMQAQAQGGLAAGQNTQQTTETPADAPQTPETDAAPDANQTQTQDAADMASSEVSVSEATPVKPTKKDQARAYAAERLGENWEADNPELSSLISDGRGIYSRGKGKKSRFESMVDKIVAEQPAAQADTAVDTPAPDAPTPTIREASTSVANNERAFQPRNKKDQAAIDYANRELGENWQTSNPELVDTLARGKYGLFTRSVDAAAQSQETDVAERQGVDVAARLVANSGEFAKTLSGNQRKVFTALLDAMRNNEGGAMVQEDGSFNTTALAERAGVKGRQAAQAALNQVRPKIAKYLGVSEAEVVTALAATNRGATEAAVEMDAPVAVLDTNELPGGDNASGSMGTVRSIGATQVEGAAAARTDKARKAEIARFKKAGMTDAQIEEFYNKQAEPEQDVDPVAEQRAQEARTETRRAEEYAVERADRVLRQEWDARRSNDGPTYDDLTLDNKIDWMRSVYEFLQSDDAGRFDTLDADQRALEQITDATGVEVTNEADQGDTVGPAQVPERLQDQRDPEVPGREGAGQQTDSVAGEDSGAVGNQAETDTGVVGTNRPAPKVEVKKRRKIDLSRKSATKFGVSDDPAEYASTESMANIVENLTGKRTHPRIHVFETEADAIRAIENGEVPATDVDRIRQARPYGFVTIDSKGRPHAHFILNRIPAGGEMAAFMHEVGEHMGVDQILPSEQRDLLVGKIGQWADKDDNSLESTLARAAIGAVTEARLRGAVADMDYSSEVLAYFLEEASLRGIQPTVQTPVGRLLRDLYAAFKRALRKLNLVNIDTVTPQHIVDLAYGAARIELSTRKHGTGADFRAFKHKYMGTGEGNQAFGFGTYLAERFGIARNYLRQMENKASRRSRKVDNPRLSLTAIPAVVEKLRTPGIRMANNEGMPYTSPIFRGGRIVGERAITQDEELADRIANGGVIRRGWLGFELVVEADAGDFRLKNLPIILDRLMHPTENRPLFSQQELNDLHDEMRKVEYPDGAPEGTFMHVDTTVDDSEMVDWYGDMRSESGQRLLNLIEQQDAEVTNAVGRELTAYVREKQGLDDIQTVDDDTWNEMVLDTTVGELYNLLAMGRISSLLRDRIDPDAAAQISSYESRRVRNDATVSAFLDENGIKGVIYADANSRGVANDRRMFNRVVFNDQNLIVVGRTRGGRVSDTQETVSEVRFGIVRDWVRQKGGATSAQFIDDASFIARNAVASTKFLHQFIRENKETMPSAGRWYQGMLESEKTRNDIRGQVEAIATQARDLAPDRLAAVNDFIGKSTFFQKWGYDPQWQGKTVKVDPIMSTAFQRLTAEEQQLVKAVFQHGENMRQRKIAIAKKLGVQGKFFSDASLEGPYAPLKRFGNFAGELKSQQLIDAERDLAQQPNKINRDRVAKLKADSDHYVISFFDTMGAAQRFADENSQKYTFAVASERAPDVGEDRVPNPEVFEKVLGALKADQKSGLDPAAKQAFEGMVKNLYFQSLDERSARLSGARRLNRAGYEKNMIRSFLSHARAEAALIANMEHGAEINTAFAEAANEARANRANLQSVYNMIARHYKDTLSNKETPIQDRIAAMNSVYMLTTSVGYHVTNATQPMMVTIPRIAGDFNNYTGAWSALLRGYKVAVSTARMSKTLQTDIDLSKAPPKYRAMLEELQLRQLLDVGMEEDLSEFDRFNTGYEPLNQLSDTLGKVVHKLYQVARFVEAQNRISAAVAAYDMALDNRQTLATMKMTPQEYATAVVEDTQGNFARMDAPLLIKSLPKLTVQYRKYQFMMAWAYANATNQAFAGDTPQVKAMGRRTLGYMLAHAGLFAGATGIPLLTTIAPYALAFMGEGDEPQDLERWIRANVDDERLADVLTRGLPAFFGIDMSTKLSQASIFTPFPYVDLQANEEGAKDLFFNALFGPAGTTFVNFFRSAEYFGQGDILKGIEYAVPKGIRTLIESYRFATEGFTYRNGDVVVDPRDFDVRSLLLNAMGIPATDVNQIRWTRGQQFELEQWFSGESSRLRREYIRANQARDRDAMRALREEWRELQDSKDRVRPFFNDSRNVLRRQPVTDLMRAPREQQRRELRSRQQMGTE